MCPQCYHWDVHAFSMTLPLRCTCPQCYHWDVHVLNVTTEMHMSSMLPLRHAHVLNVTTETCMRSQCYHWDVHAFSMLTLRRAHVPDVITEMCVHKVKAGTVSLPITLHVYNHIPGMVELRRWADNSVVLYLFCWKGHYRENRNKKAQNRWGFNHPIFQLSIHCFFFSED